MRLIAGLVLVCIVLQCSASLLGSMRGEYGLAVAACVFVAVWAVQRALHGEDLRVAGIRPATGGGRGFVVALVLGGALIAAAPLYLAATGTHANLYGNTA